MQSEVAVPLKDGTESYIAVPALRHNQRNLIKQTFSLLFWREKKNWPL